MPARSPTQVPLISPGRFGVRNWPLWGTDRPSWSIALAALGYGIGRFGVRYWPLWGTILAALGYDTGRFGVRERNPISNFGAGRFGVRSNHY